MDAASRLLVRRILAAEGIDGPAVDALVPAYGAIADRIAAHVGGDAPLVVGICGPQGSGKSTLVLVLAALLTQAGWPTAQLSLDDLYLPAAERRQLAATVHPLLRTRGVPGTHDIPLGLALLSALARAGPDDTTAIPRFDKASDDRLPEPQWPRFHGRPAIVLLEGWCVGARPQPQAELATPLNALEREEDPDCTWRQTVNGHLATDYQALFGRLGLLILLQAPGFERVFAWRKQQEDKLRTRLRIAGRDEAQAGVMDDQQLIRFIRHYERLTRHILAEMPRRADIVLTLDDNRAIVALH